MNWSTVVDAIEDLITQGPTKVKELVDLFVALGRLEDLVSEQQIAFGVDLQARPPTLLISDLKSLCSIAIVDLGDPALREITRQASTTEDETDRARRLRLLIELLTGRPDSAMPKAAAIDPRDPSVRTEMDAIIAWLWALRPSEAFSREHLTPEEWTEVQAALKSENAYDRLIAVERTAETRHPEGATVLLPLLNDPREDVRAAVAEALLILESKSENRP